MLVLIRVDPEASPFIGEGHRKAWARLCYGKKTRVNKSRAMGIMRENNLLSPHRVPKTPPREHDGTIITTEPDVMWATDGARFFTLDDGWGWVFAEVEHWNAECIGRHVTKKGNWFAALEPVTMGLEREFGRAERGIARGISLRMDHGNVYTSEHFTNQAKSWGFALSYTYTSEPETNAAAESFFGHLESEFFYGRAFGNTNELIAGIENWIDWYNNERIKVRLGGMNPVDYRLA